MTTIEIIEKEGLFENARVVGAYAFDQQHDMKARHPLIGDVRGVGLQIGVELVLDRQDKTPATDAAEAVMYAALERELNFKVTMSSILTLAPPLIIHRDEMDSALDILEACIGEAERGLY